jgi:hypothetical protein
MFFPFAACRPALGPERGSPVQDHCPLMLLKCPDSSQVVKSSGQRWAVVQFSRQGKTFLGQPAVGASSSLHLVDRKGSRSMTRAPLPPRRLSRCALALTGYSTAEQLSVLASRSV